jgi:hypothetical protein
MSASFGEPYDRTALGWRERIVRFMVALTRVEWRGSFGIRAGRYSVRCGRIAFGGVEECIAI